MLEQELEDLQKENSSLAAIINGQNVTSETMRTDCDKWREQFTREKKLTTELTNKLAQNVEAHDSYVRKLKEMHTKQLTDLQENEIKPCKNQIADLTSKLAKAQEQIRSCQQTKLTIENKYLRDM